MQNHDVRLRIKNMNILLHRFTKIQPQAYVVGLDPTWTTIFIFIPPLNQNMIENFNGNVYRLIPQPAKFIVVYVATVIRKEFRHARIKISRRYNFGPECSTAC